MPSGLELPEDLKGAVGFHGHLCPGLVMGYVASKAALEWLGACRSEDEELVAIVENDSCAVDAVQWLTGCTFGKGNFFFRDFGKHVYTFAVRPSGRAVRASLRPETSQLPGSGDREECIRRLLDEPVETSFTVEETVIELPPQAQRRASIICAECGEPVMDSRVKRSGGLDRCIPCSEAAEKR